MSVIIRSMAMPDNCSDCQLEYDQMMCSVCGCRWYDKDRIDSGFNPITERLPECPLIAIPTPHGRLIDADALADDLEWDAQHFDDEHELKFNAAAWLRSNQNKVYFESEM